MVKNRDLIIAVLITFCLTAMLFLVKPTQSQTSSNYNPFYDLNHDGKIDMKDIALEARAFGGTGDPTENVNVTNWGDQYSCEDYGILNFTFAPVGGGGYSGSWNSEVNCSGYSSMEIIFSPQNASIGNYNATIALAGLYWKATYSLPTPYCHELLGNNNNGTIYQSGTSTGYDPQIATMYETKAPYCTLIFDLFSTTTTPVWATFDFYVYLRND
ncbi:MAG: hypothetical protein ABSB89_06480 [Candidatus Bathyarchaeia archaeon]|jgi:hypothetical protein